MNLFESAEAARDEAIARVDRNAPEAWKREALEAVRLLCLSRQTIDTDLVWGMVGQSPPEPRALGAVMRSAQRLGWCVPTDRTRKSVRPECHARPIRVWMSCRYRAETAA